MTDDEWHSLDPQLKAKLGHLMAEATRIICRSLPEVRTEELRTLIRDNIDVPHFKDLALTMILLAEGEE